MVTVTSGSFSSYQSLNLCGAGCTEHEVPVICFVRLYLCLCHAPVYLWGSLRSILRCFGCSHLWCQPRSALRGQWEKCWSLPCQYTLFVLLLLPHRRSGKRRNNNCSLLFCSGMDNWGLKLCSGSRFSH